MYRETVLSQPRTTNSCESWHRSLETVFVNPHPDIHTFIKKLMGEWLKIKSNIDMISRGDRKKVKRTMNKSEIQREKRMKDVAQRCSGFTLGLIIWEQWRMPQRNDLSKILKLLINIKNYALQCLCLNCTLPEVKFCVKN